MDGAQTLLGEAGACPEIDWNGTTWRIGWPTQAAKARLEELLAATAVRETLALKDVLPPAEFAALFGRLEAQIRNREFRTFGDQWQAALTTPTWAVLFLLSLLRTHHPAATEDDARALAAGKPEEVSLAVERVAPRFFELAAAGMPGVTPAHLAAVRTALAAARTGTTSPPSTPP